jgi:hypothetical protein
MSSWPAPGCADASRGSSCDDHASRDGIGVQHLDQASPPGQHFPLVDVTLVGDLAGIQVGGLGHDQQPLDAHGRPGIVVVGRQRLGQQLRFMIVCANKLGAGRPASTYSVPPEVSTMFMLWLPPKV